MEAQASFPIQSVVHLVRPTGKSARTMDELRAGISDASDACLFHHGLQYQLRNPATRELPPDDFSGWVGGVVQDRETAERLSFAVQTHNRHPGELRPALVGVLDTVPAATRATRAAPEGGAFVFLENQPVAIPTGVEAFDGAELVEALVEADESAWFYHVIEQPWFAQDRPTVIEWLESRGDSRLAVWLVDLASAGLPIELARERFLRRWRHSRLGRSVGESAHLPDDMRREAGREVVGRLVRRMRNLPRP